METKQIKVAARAEFGNNAARRLRRQGLIPAIVYGNNKEPQALTVNADEWSAFSARHGAHLVSLQLDGKEIPALVKEVQFNYLKNYVVHIDFQAVDLNAEISSTVPLHAFGDCYGAAHGGILEQELHELPVVCRPADLPESIKVDVTKLEIGDALTVADIELPAGVKADIDSEAVVFHVVRQQEEQEPEAEAEGEAATEPEAINEQKTESRAAEKEAKAKENK